MYNKNLKTTFSSRCEEKKCELISIAPFEYTLTISKEGYKDFQKEIKIESKQDLSLDVELAKQIQITEVTQVENEEIEQTNQEKIDEVKQLQDLKSSYFYTTLPDGTMYYFLQDQNALILYKKGIETDTSLYTFPLVPKSSLEILPIYETSSQIAVVV